MFKDQMWIKWMFRFLILYILVLVGEDVLVLQRGLRKFDISWRLGEIWMTASLKTMEPGYLKCRFCVCFLGFFLAFDFCRFCVVIRSFHPRHNGQWPMTSKDFYTRSYPLQYFLILILEKEPVFPFSMLGAKQGNYWYHFYNVFGMTRSLTGDWTRDLPHSMSALMILIIYTGVFCLS